MATANITFYKYLEAAFKFKLNTAEGRKTSFDTKFNYSSYNLPFDRIFHYARKVLPEFYGDTVKFPDTEEGNLRLAQTILDKLNKHDAQLEELFNQTDHLPEHVEVVKQASAESLVSIPQEQLVGVGAFEGGGSHLPPIHHLTNVPQAVAEKDIKPAVETTPGKTAVPKSFIRAFEKDAPAPKFHAPAPVLPNAAKSFGSKLGVFFQRNAGKYLTVGRAAAGISGIIGGAVGMGVAGPPGMAAGIGIGVLTPSFIRSGGGKALGSLGGKAINFGENISHQASRISTPKIPKKAWLIIVGLLIFLMFSSSLTNPGGISDVQTPQPAPIVGSGDLASCSFTRAGTKNTIKSSVLRGWITDAANLHGIPPAILASVAMHEAQGFLITKGDDSPEIQSGQYCADGKPVCVDMSLNRAISTEACTSEQLAQPLPSDSSKPLYRTATAKGLMQLLDIYNEGFPFCDIKANIQKAAETLKGKLGAGSWSNGDDIKKSVCGYFGKPNQTSCVYPGGDYGPEVSEDQLRCQQTGTTTPFTPIPYNPSLATIVQWDERIVNSLEPGFWGLYNKLMVNPPDGITNSPDGTYRTGIWPATGEGNLYWCTYSIVDSYNLAGFSGLDKGAHGGVVYMRIFWKGAQAQNLGYKYLDYEGNKGVLNSVHPGYAMFMELDSGRHTGFEHVAMVIEINIDHRGNGNIKTRDSNSSSGRKVREFSIEEGNIKNTSYPVRGFGGI